MAEIASLGVAAVKLMYELNKIRTLKNYNAQIVREINDFNESIQTDLKSVEAKLKTLNNEHDQSWAIESLQKDLEEATEYLEGCRNQGWIEGYWDAEKTRRELSALRRKLSHSFQVKLFFTTLEVIIDREKRTDAFHSELLQLSNNAATQENMHNATGQIKNLLKPMITRLRQEDRRYLELRAEIRALSTSSASGDNSSLDTDKFLEDILFGLTAEAEDDDTQDYCDPNTCELMCDPVKCVDGLTYDRFSVLENHEGRNKLIVCEDVNLRSRLFEKFPTEKLDERMRSKRASYRSSALKLAQLGQFGEALVSLDNVLQWAPNDAKCLGAREKMRASYRKAALNLAESGPFPDALIMLETVSKWSPYDRECFEKYDTVKRRKAASHTDHRPTGHPQVQERRQGSKSPKREPEPEPERSKLIFFDGKRFTFDLEDLLRSSGAVLGKGSLGTTYKAELDDGTVFAVKRLKDVMTSKRDFENQIDAVGRMEEKHLVSLRAYYFSKDEKLLVYDYMPEGSLSALLHGTKGSSRTPLDWISRVRIATGAARGLAYLHTEQNFTHDNIKSSNVLLTRDLEGCISDFGLAQLLSSSAAASRMIGYKAPEVVETRKVSQKTDVYSFGVLLLELLTGKAPTQASLNDEGIDLPRWVQSVVREEWTSEVFDLELMRYQNIEEEMVQMLQVAMQCVAQAPEQRPSMDQVVKLLEDIRQFSDSGNENGDDTSRSAYDTSAEKSKEEADVSPFPENPSDVHPDGATTSQGVGR